MIENVSKFSNKTANDLVFSQIKANIYVGLSQKEQIYLAMEHNRKNKDFLN